MKSKMKKMRLEDFRVTSFTTSKPMCEREQRDILGMGTLVSCDCTGMVYTQAQECR